MATERVTKNLLVTCLAISFICLVQCRAEFGMSQQNTDGWLNPDDLFAPAHTLKTESVTVNEDFTKCQEDLKVCTEKISDCKILAHSTEEKSLVESTSRSECIPVPAEETDGAKVYLQRFIHLLLDVSNLNTEDVDQVNKAEFSFFISDEQLLTLRQFASEGNAKSVPLRKVDEIFAAVLAKPYIKLPNFERLLNKLPDIKVGSFFITVFLPSIWFFSILFTTRSIRKTFIWFLPVIFLTSFITTATQMFEDAHLKNYELIKSNKDLPSNCKTGNMFGSYSSECFSYFKAHNIDPNLGITPMKILTKMFGETLAETMGNFGSGCVGFFGSIQELGWISQLYITPIAVVLLCFFLVLIFLVLTGGSIRLPWFLGGGVSFNNPSQNGTVNDDQDRKNVQTTRNLSTAPSITFNISGPANVQDILRSLQGDQPPNSPSSMNTRNLPQITSSVVDDPLAAGDTLTQGLQDHVVGSSYRSHRPVLSIGSKKILKQFSQLNAKYKSGNKSSGKSRNRHVSL